MGQFNMKIGLYLTFIFLVTFSTINAGSKLKSFLKIPPKAVTRTCSCKIKGVQYKIRNVPTQCCSRNGRIKWNTKSKLRSGYCQAAFCPLLKALKGCNFMCNFYLCNQNKGGEAKCKKCCNKPTSTKGLTMTTSTSSPNARTTKSLCPVQVAIFGCKVVCTNPRTKKCRDYYGGKNKCMDQCMQKTTSATNSTAPSTPSTTSTTSTTKPTISTKKSSNTKPPTSTIKPTASTTKPTASNTKPTASSAKARASNSSASTTKTPKGTINPTKTSAKTKLATKPKSKNNTKPKPKPKFKL